MLRREGIGVAGKQNGNEKLWLRRDAVKQSCEMRRSSEDGKKGKSCLGMLQKRGCFGSVIMECPREDIASRVRKGDDVTAGKGERG